MPKAFLNKEREAYMRANYLVKSSGEIAADLNTSRSTINKYYRILGLKVPDHIISQFRVKGLIGRTSFTEEMDEFLLDNYLTMPVKRLGKLIGKSYCGVMIRMKQLGLEIPKNIVEQRKRASRFNKGHVPANKGKKLDDFMSPENKANFLANSFKKGNKPHNEKYDGYERFSKDGYTEVRIESGLFVFKHRLIWETEHGPIPEGYLIVFKDGNKKNFNLNNLECVSKKEHMLNNTIHQYPKDLQKSIVLYNKLNKQL